ncbi:TonB family protein [Colwellia sp. Arc7-635]|jgi:protein TonB|uniref:TonB family protein n=1 Tax=Colwellia sp. Arc7-635 TaxID=2497879 RepID=UPI000F84FB57|nr:TonB family protein [Colwellia sp. Arc7-635]AZQ82723.1 TonB family protein [Colwellia sp. Arc7-635]
MKKVITITMLASATTFGLFAFMSYLVSNDQVLPPEILPDVIVEVAQLQEEKPAKVITRFTNVPPPMPKPMPRTFETIVETNVEGGYDYESPVINLNNDGPSLTLGNNTRDNDARPVVRINPKYPIDAARDGTEGWVKLRFDINALGSVTNIEVIDAQPKRVFNKAARQALKKWKYRAKSTAGKTVAQQGLTVQLDFNIDQQS